MAYSNFYARIHAFSGRTKDAFWLIFRSAPSAVYFIIFAATQLLAWFQAWSIKNSLSGDILVLHYNVDFGIDLVGSPARIYIYPLFGLAVFVINLLLLLFLSKDKNIKIFSHLLLGAAALFGIFLCLALLAVYLINFR